MKRALLPVAALAAAAAAILPAPASAGVVGGAVIVGNGVTRIGTDFNFFGQIISDEAFGTASFTRDGLAPRIGPIVCAKIQGRRAIFGVQTGEGLYHTFVVDDLGNNPTSPVDRVRGSDPLGTEPTCSTVPYVGPYWQITSGDIVVASDPFAT